MDNMESILIIAIGLLATILCGLIMWFVLLKVKDAQAHAKPKAKKINKKKNIESNNSIDNPGQKTSYSKHSIKDFLEFDDIIDNMIVQDDGKRYLMVIKCQGINYDLMSEIEKTAVEEGFVQFLNTLRYKVQIYIQTRKVNLESSIINYEKNIEGLKDNLQREQEKYQTMIESKRYSQEDLNKEKLELVRLKNLYEYGQDVIANTKNMSLNKNILTKEYYIIIPYYTSEIDGDDYDRNEKENIAFSELYTRASSIVRTLAGCEMTGYILSSMELIDLLYVAYNRDDAETYGIDKYLAAEADSLYSTSEDVYEKKIKLLNQEIEKEAIEKAQNAIDEVQTEYAEQYREKEKNKRDYVDDLAMFILEENEKTFGKDVIQKAKNKVSKKKRVKETQ